MNDLSQFSDLSGLTSSIHKSIVFLSNCDPDVVSWFDNMYNISHGQLQVKFLGVPLITTKLSTNDCMPLISNLSNRINATIIALIRKISTPTHMTDYRPISLCSVAYKYISKILANRLKIVWPQIIDMAQSAFVKGKSITDNIFMAYELFKGYNRESGTAKCALKIDLHKAFDSIRWDFIIQILIKMQLPQSLSNGFSLAVQLPDSLSK
ncbi:hypothetical protein AgCh_023213 [Apium graveolens]